MTEEAYFSSAAQKEAFAELGVEQYEIIATLDTHTSDICRSLDGKVYPMKDYEAGVTAPPFHVWCRSTTAPYFEDDFGEVGERAARDENGKTYSVPADMTYAEWEYIQSGKDLTTQDFNDIIFLKGKVSNENVRKWYVAHCKRIPNLIDQSQSLEERARQSFELRNKIRFEAWELMHNQNLRKELDAKEPSLSFEEFIQKKMKEKNMSYHETLKYIVGSALRTRKSVNEQFGVE